MAEEGYNFIDTKMIHNGPVRLRIDSFTYRGKTFRKEVVEHNPSVGIIPVINKNEILLIRQFRHAVNKNLVEIPAGKIENNELPQEAAKRGTGLKKLDILVSCKPLSRCFPRRQVMIQNLMHFFCRYSNWSGLGQKPFKMGPKTQNFFQPFVLSKY